MSDSKKLKLPQEVFDLYDDYAHNRIERRLFLDKLSLFAVGGITLPLLLKYLMPDYQTTALVDPNDPRLECEYITYDSPKGGGSIKGLLCRPKNSKKKLPGIVVVHENRGLNPYIEDVGRRAALAGFISLAPDALTPLGGYPGNDDEGRTLQAQRNRDEMLEDFIAAYQHLSNYKNCSGKVGVVGFCFGGWIANMMAVKIEKLGASVPYYGGQPPTELVGQIKAPLLIQYAELDTRVNEGWPAYEAALKANNINYEMKMYEKVNHGFHNDSTPRFDKEAAELSWKRTIDFFNQHLK